jgi:hypothetical protein
MQLHQGFVTGEMGFGRPFTLQKPDPPMSALGQKRTLRSETLMSAKCQKQTRAPQQRDNVALASHVLEHPKIGTRKIRGPAPHQG